MLRHRPVVRLGSALLPHVEDSILALCDVADYINRFYNGTRRHSHLGGVSPDQFEALQRRR